MGKQYKRRYFEAYYTYTSTLFFVQSPRLLLTPCCAIFSREARSARIWGRQRQVGGGREAISLSYIHTTL